MKPPPAFQFYAADWLADANVQLMTLEEEGAYIRLLAYCWREGSIPDNDEALSRLCKGGSKMVLTVVRKCFQPNPNHPYTLIHPRLEIERAKQAEWKLKSSIGGTTSAAMRKNKAAAESKGGSTTVPRVVEECLVPFSNSSSSNRNRAIALSADADDFAPLMPDVVSAPHSFLETRKELLKSTSTPAPEFELSPPETNRKITGRKPEDWRTGKFDEFWGVVWAKIAKGKARKKFFEKARTPELADRIIACARAQAPNEREKAAKRDGGAFLHPATWLNDERWDDDVNSPIAPKSDLPDLTGKTAEEIWG